MTETKRTWQPWEDEFIDTHYKTHGPDFVHALIPHRTGSAISQRASILGFTGKGHGKKFDVPPEPVQNATGVSVAPDVEVVAAEAVTVAPVPPIVAAAGMQLLTPLESAIARLKKLDRVIEDAVNERARTCREISLLRSKTAKHTGCARRVA